MADLEQKLNNIQWELRVIYDQVVTLPHATISSQKAQMKSFLSDMRQINASLQNIYKQLNASRNHYRLYTSVTQRYNSVLRILQDYEKQLNK